MLQPIAHYKGFSNKRCAAWEIVWVAAAVTTVVAAEAVVEAGAEKAADMLRAIADTDTTTLEATTSNPLYRARETDVFRADSIM